MNEIRYTKTHEWLKLENDLATIGITPHAQSLLGDLVFVELPEIGAHYNAEQACGVVESVKAASDIYAPIQGTIVDVNTALSTEPALMNEDPTGRGWFIKMRPDNPHDILNLLTEETYHNTVVEEH